MSSVKFVWEGFEDLKIALRALPEELTVEAAHIIEGAWNGAAVDIKAGYPSESGLGRTVTVSHRRDRFGAVSTIRNTSPRALWFEEGTQVRHTSFGANRGAQEAKHVFYPPIRKARRKGMEDLKALLVRKGLLVTGDA
jgi:hypothetical protein